MLYERPPLLDTMMIISYRISPEQHSSTARSNFNMKEEHHVALVTAEQCTKGTEYGSERAPTESLLYSTIGALIIRIGFWGQLSADIVVT